jgi:hypothetical protein
LQQISLVGAGQGATNAYGSNFLVKLVAPMLVNSNFFGTDAGYLATGASNSLVEYWAEMQVLLIQISWVSCWLSSNKGI